MRIRATWPLWLERCRRGRPVRWLLDHMSPARSGERCTEHKGKGNLHILLWAVGQGVEEIERILGTVSELAERRPRVYLVMLVDEGQAVARIVRRRVAVEYVTPEGIWPNDAMPYSRYVGGRVRQTVEDYAIDLVLAGEAGERTDDLETRIEEARRVASGSRHEWR